MATKAGEYEKVFENIKESAKPNVELKNEPFSKLRANTYKFLKSIQGKTLTNKQSNIKAYVNSDGAKKMVSDAAIEKSKNNGYNAREHLSVANKIDELFENANFVNEIADKNGHESIKRLNFEAPVIVGENKAVALITAKKSIDKDLNTIYSLELQEIKQADIRGGKAQTAQKQVINEKMTHALPKTSADKQAFIVKNSTTTANKSQEVSAVEPIKEFGTNYAEFYHDGKNAIRKLLAERQGQVAGAFERKELGDIDLVWGEITDAIKHKGYGLAHILDKRIYQYIQQGLSKEQAEQKAIELINKLPEIIKNGEIVKKPNEAIQIIADNIKIVLKSNYYGKPTNKWIVTTYERLEKDLDISAKPITKGTNSPLNSSVNSTTTANKSQDELENILKGAEGKEYPNTIAGRWEKKVDEAFSWAYKNIYAKGVRSGIKGASKITTFFGGDGDMVSRGLEKTLALQDEIGALSRAKSAYQRNNQVARAEAMKVYENLVKLKIEERVALFRMLDGQEVEANLSQKLRPIYEKLRDKIDERAEQLISLGALKGENAKENYIKYSYSQYYKDNNSKGFGIGKLKARNESLKLF